VFENGVLRRVFEPKRDEVTGEWRKLHNEELHDLIPYPILCGWLNRELDERGMWHVWGRREGCTGCW
jgi:hypothetical protein